MNYSETYFELDSEEASHCHLICCVYIKGHVKTINTKDQSNAIVYCVCYVVCRHCQYWCLQLLHNTVYRVMRCENSTLYTVASNTVYVDTVDIRYILMHSIFKKFWKAETEGLSTIPSILYMSILSIQDKDL